MHIVDKKLAYIIQLRLGMELYPCPNNVLLCTDHSDPTFSGWLWRLLLQLKSLINLVLQRIPGRQRFSIYIDIFEDSL